MKIKKSFTVKIQLPEDSENILAVNDDEIRDEHLLCDLNLYEFEVIEITSDHFEANARCG